jgi:uncharacterized protein YdgA (DUF945 family)
MVRHISVYIQVKKYPVMAVNVDLLMVLIMAFTTVAVTTSATGMNEVSDMTAIKTQDKAATTTSRTMEPTTPILELLSLCQGLTR